MSSADDPVRVSELPARVRAKVISLASQGIAKMPRTQVPASLRKSVGFAPAKRAKLVGPQIVAAVELDEDFREHLATQVRALVPDVVAEIEAGPLGPDASLVECAAAAF